MADFDLCAYLWRDKKHLFQYALPLEKANPKKLRFPMYASEKFDGVFCAALQLPDGSVGIFSRTGERYTSMKHLEEVLRDDLMLGNGEMLLFEAYCNDIPQSIISGWCRDQQNQHPQIMAMLHTYVQRNGWQCLTKMDAESIGTVPSVMYGPYVHLVRHVLVESLDEAKYLANVVWDVGGEGIVLNAIDAFYQPGKRNESMIKIKRVLSYDLEVVGVYEGKGKYAGTLGGLVCRWRGGKTIKVSGMSDDQRNEWYRNPDRIIGRIVEVHAMDESSKGLLREPRFKVVRFDKVQADV